MSNFGQGILTGWGINNVWGYVLSAFVGLFVIRGLLTTLFTWQAFWRDVGIQQSWPGYRAKWWMRFKGVSGPAYESSPDYWIASTLGLIELFVFPVLMRANAWTAIGAWIGFKAIAQWILGKPAGILSTYF